jgi:hypothetical protein
MGTMGILNVGAGDTKLTFDKNNPAELIRSGRIVTDMLQRGYALLIEVPGKKGQPPTYQRVYSFREDTSEYIIADLDPLQAAKADEAGHAQSQPGEETAAIAATEPEPTKPRAKPGRKTRAISATGTTGVAVARSAGG